MQIALEWDWTNNNTAQYGAWASDVCTGRLEGSLALAAPAVSRPGEG